MAHSVKASAKRSKPEGDAVLDRAASGPLPLGPGARTNGRIVFALVLLALGLWTAASFLPPLIWATILAVALWPLYLKFASRFMDGPSPAAAMLFTVLVALILITPISLAVYTIAEQSDMLLNWFKRAREGGIEVPDWVARLPIAAESTQQWWRANLSDPKAATAWLKSLNAENVSDLFTTFGGQLIHRLFMLFFSLLALFALLRHGRAVASRVLGTCDRLFGEAGEGLVEKMVDATRATVNGTGLVAFGEGLMIGLIYFVVGVPNALTFLILTTAFAMIPFGAWFAFTAAAVGKIAAGGSGCAAAAVFVWGTAVMLAGDHFVWPPLVSGAARLPFLLAFVGIFGGMAAFGLIGLFVGPVIMAALLSMWREWIFRPVQQE